MADPSRDYYARTLASDAYRASRGEKAELIAGVCGDLIVQAERIVDLGCGTGLIKDALSRRFGRSIVGVELSPGFVQAKENVVIGDLLALPFRSHAFDFGLCNHVYEHVADQPAFFAELRRVMALSGKVYLTAGSKYAIIEPHYRLPLLSWLPRRWANRYLRASGRGTAYEGIRFRGHGSLVSMIRDAGFSIEDRTRSVILGHGSRIRSTLARMLGRLLGRLPTVLGDRLLAVASPQWFFILGPADRVTGREHEQA